MNSFYDTINTPEQLLIEFDEAAKSQEQQVFEIFKSTRSAFSWFELANQLPDMNQVSLKRSLSTLKSKGKLVKTNTQVLGPCGKNTYRYKLI